MKQMKKRLTYANVMSSLAVFLVLGGATAFAAVELGKETVGTKQLKKEAVSLAKIKKGAKTALKGQAGPAGPQGPAGPTGPKGATGPAGSAVAYAHIESDGSLDTANSSNITSVTSPRTGEYCIDLPFVPKVVASAPDGFGPEDGILVNPTISSTGLGECEGGEYRVRITTAEAPHTLADHPFYLIFE